MDTLPRNPDNTWLSAFFSKSLNHCSPYHIDELKVPVKLDQNESPHDWPAHLKEKVLKRLMETDWNRYPVPYSPELHQLLGEYAGVEGQHILAGPGSHHLLCTLLSLFGGGIRGNLIIARPSFPLYEQHCRAHNIDYITWDLDQSLNYSKKALPAMPKGSVLLFASPNNPVGNILPYDLLANLLEENPDSFIIADEAYYEFSSKPYTPLLNEHSNLILVRTLSKAMATAGLRVGYVIAATGIIESLKKMTLPYLLNHFSIVAATELLRDKQSIRRMQETVEFVCREKERIVSTLTSAGKDLPFEIIPSGANFLLFRWHSQDACTMAYEKLISQGVLTRNVSAGPGLSGCLRITIGNTGENDKLLGAFKV